MGLTEHVAFPFLQKVLALTHTIRFFYPGTSSICHVHKEITALPLVARPFSHQTRNHADND
ncbi:MAG TPA: hypothetical protein ENK14_11835 [Caldithrix sp.]|nr:hypothetical protein [Caldithrix sp.]